MSSAGLEPQVVNVPLVAGLAQKSDPRALQPPGLLIAKDIQFEELGGIQTRHPTSPIGVEVVGGGVLANIRRIERNGDEWLCFTKDSLFSRNAQQAKWSRRGTHLAIVVDEQSMFATTGDQLDCDSAELDGTTFVTWMEEDPHPLGNVQYGYVAAYDTATGAVLMAPTRLTFGQSRVRLVALESRVLLVCNEIFGLQPGAPGVYAYALDPADPGGGLAAAPATLADTGTGNGGFWFDVVKTPGADEASFVVGNPAGAGVITVGTVTAALVVARSNKVRATDGPIAISVDPTGTTMQVVRGAGGANILGDRIVRATLADAAVGIALGAYAAPLNQITAAHKLTADGGAYRCHAFWSSSQSTGSAAWGTKSNWVNTAGVVGVESMLCMHLALSSRAFAHEDHVFFWGVFAGASSHGTSAVATFGAQLQNTYFLYREDGHLSAKAAPNTASGFADTDGVLPGVQATDTGYLWAGGRRGVLPLDGGRTRYAARDPRLVRVQFDRDEARRCVRLGNTLYIASGEGLVQYDGRQLVEVGFLTWPWDLFLAIDGAGGMENGVYSYKASYRWRNATGEEERSAAPLIGNEESLVGEMNVGRLPSLHRTRKAERPVAIEVWRTAKNPPDGAPFYLATSPDPADAADVNNEYLANDLTDAYTEMVDSMADADLATKPSNPENGGALENQPPPACTIVVASADRLFLAGVAGDPDRVWYSKLRGDGEIAAFHEQNTIAIPPEGGRITGLGFIDQTLIVHRESAVYAIAGDGYDNDNAGGGTNYEARKLPGNVGASSHESIAEFERGQIFKSAKGWQLLTRGLTVEYIGGPVSDYDAEAVRAVHVLKDRHQIRCLTSARLLVLDTLAGQWCEWTIAGAVHAAIWSTGYHYASAASIEAESADYAGVDYGLDVETGWIKVADLQGFGRVWKILVLGEYRGPHKLRIRLARNYRDEYFQDKLWTVSPTVVGGPEQVSHGPSIQQCQAIKIRITAVGADAVVGGYTAPTGEALKLTGLALELGLQRGVNRNLSPSQKQ